MLIFKMFRVTAALFAMGLVLSPPAQALDASKIIQKDTKSSKIFELFFGFVKEGRNEDAFDVLKYAADEGNSAAQWKLAKLYETGEQGVQKDPMQAFKLFQLVARQYPNARPNTPSWQFSADALVALGNYYRKGIPGTILRPDPLQAATMYTTAAMVFRHPDAQFELGRMQIKNDHVFGQGRSGVRNLGLSMEKGHVGAEALLGHAHFEGIHVKRDVIRGLIYIGHAKCRAKGDELEWISQLYEEAFSLALPEQRRLAHQSVREQCAFE